MSPTPAGPAPNRLVNRTERSLCRYTPGAQALHTRQIASPTSPHRETPIPARSKSAQRSESSGSDEQTPSQAYCDERLRDLDISFWTQVPITSECAARVISLYLETDHPLLGAFDPDMFVEDLTQHRHRLCSPFLVNALLFLACVSHPCFFQVVSGSSPTHPRPRASFLPLGPRPSQCADILCLANVLCRG